MTKFDTARFGSRASRAALALAAMATGATLATATPAAAEHTARDQSADVTVTTRLPSPPAIPGVPDVGLPSEGAGGRDASTVDPQGRKVPSHVDDNAVSTRASGYTATVVTANGARIRSYPVTGTVVGLAYRGNWFYVSCQRRATDGYRWGYGVMGSRRGWMRDDLWDVIYSTAPGAPAPRPIPYC